MLPLSLYIHLPWCVRKCPYCDFNSHPQRGDLPEAAYRDTLLRDLENLLPRVWGRPVSSVYFGGGTPSLFSAASIGAVLSGVRARLSLTPDCEITLEANPGTVEYDRFEAYRAAGVNRISVGVQSFADESLRQLGRIHDGVQAQRAIEAILTAGFEQFNIDLMHGLPGQSAAQAAADVDTALRFKPPHVSHYQLTLEPNTAFAAQPPTLPDEAELADIQAATHERLGAAGLNNYEVSAWARAGCASRHNMNYWHYGDYLGIGAGAHGKLTDLATRRVWRYARLRHPRGYLAAPERGEWNGEAHELTPDDLQFEYFFNGLRLREGVSLSRFTERTGLALERVQACLEAAVARGLLTLEGDRAMATALGWRFMNDLQGLFLPD